MFLSCNFWNTIRACTHPQKKKNNNNNNKSMYFRYKDTMM